MEPSCAEANGILQVSSWILCLLLSSEDQFNDSLTFQYRQLAKSAPKMKFDYVDKAGQREFVNSLDLTVCEGTLDSTGCRKVSKHMLAI